ncbi:MAG: hypothetical protein HYU66_29140 [Armatimonadetes bacterium]|nr:hypothetical protein [Armatimonadota bacterium]
MGTQNLLVALIVALAALSLVRRLWSLAHGRQGGAPCSACPRCAAGDTGGAGCTTLETLTKAAPPGR